MEVNLQSIVYRYIHYTNRRLKHRRWNWVTLQKPNPMRYNEHRFHHFGTWIGELSVRIYRLFLAKRRTLDLRAFHQRLLLVAPYTNVSTRLFVLQRCSSAIQRPWLFAVKKYVNSQFGYLQSMFNSLLCWTNCK